MISFTDADHGQIAVLEIHVLPGALVEFADEVEDALLRDGSTGLSGQALVDKARAEVIEVGRQLLDPEVVRYLVSRVATDVTAADPGSDLASVAEKARAEVIEIGRTIGRIARRARAEVIEIGRATRRRLAGSSTLLEASVLSARAVAKPARSSDRAPSSPPMARISSSRGTAPMRCATSSRATERGARSGRWRCSPISTARKPTARSKNGFARVTSHQCRAAGRASSRARAKASASGASSA